MLGVGHDERMASFEEACQTVCNSYATPAQWISRKSALA